jgi:hypothetical protein
LKDEELEALIVRMVEALEMMAEALGNLGEAVDTLEITNENN